MGFRERQGVGVLGERCPLTFFIRLKSHIL